MATKKCDFWPFWNVSRWWCNEFCVIYRTLYIPWNIEGNKSPNKEGDRIIDLKFMKVGATKKFKIHQKHTKATPFRWWLFICIWLRNAILVGIRGRRVLSFALRELNRRWMTGWRLYSVRRRVRERKREGRSSPLSLSSHCLLIYWPATRSQFRQTSLAQWG